MTAYDSLLLVATVPLVAFGLVRYLRLLLTTGLGEEPEAVLVTDLPILVTVARLGSRLRGRHRDRVKRPSPS